ncbi:MULTISPECIES: hypothetical protein [unclassified Ensifer]|uniref:hypothetical protein n=1 Tax=unclassified Ensifer TaxID=2633371 RepID=UPI00111296E5|nr:MULTISPECIES: hypothetical protein [unclassified Ensifer]
MPSSSSIHAFARAIVIVVVMHLLLGALSPLIAPYDASALVGAPLMPPSSEFLMGTDQIGRDYFSRILEGSELPRWYPFAE